MKNAFERLRIAPGLVMSEATLRDAFRVASKLDHPDAGGEVEDFASLNEAFSNLLSPAQRLQEWLRWRGLTTEARGAIDTSLMDLFVEIGAATQRAEAHGRRREEAKSALAMAMLEDESQQCRERIETLILKVETWINHETTAFPVLEKAIAIDLLEVGKVFRNLVFLEKWRASLRAGFSRLV